MTNISCLLHRCILGNLQHSPYFIALSFSGSLQSSFLHYEEKINGSHDDFQWENKVRYDRNHITSNMGFEWLSKLGYRLLPLWKRGFLFFTVAAYVNPFVVNGIISLMFENEILVLFGTDNHRWSLCKCMYVTDFDSLSLSLSCPHSLKPLSSQDTHIHVYTCSYLLHHGCLSA